MRLTNKYQDLLHYDNGETSYYTSPSYVKVLNKLGQLEDIEEELGIDLITLLKGGKHGIWYLSNGTLYFQKLDICLVDKCFREYIDYERRYMKYYFKDYGKTWALTKEELEKGD